MKHKTVVPGQQRGDAVVRLADRTARMVIPDQEQFKFGIRGDKTVLRRCAEQRGLHVRFSRPRSGPGSESADCVAIFSPATKALKFAVNTARTLEDFFERCINAVEEFLARRPEAVPSLRSRPKHPAKKQSWPLSQLRLAELAANH